MSQTCIAKFSSYGILDLPTIYDWEVYTADLWCSKHQKNGIWTFSLKPIEVTSCKPNYTQRFFDIQYLKHKQTWSAATEQHRLSLVLENQHHLINRKIGESVRLQQFTLLSFDVSMIFSKTDASIATASFLLFSKNTLFYFARLSTRPTNTTCSLWAPVSLAPPLHSWRTS